jgi:hypothetical protein
MTRSLLPGLALSIALASAFHHVALDAGTSCESLASLKLPNTTITVNYYTNLVNADSLAPEERRGRSDKTVLPGSSGRRVQRDQKHGRGGELRVPGALTGELQGFRVPPPATGKRVDP